MAMARRIDPRTSRFDEILQNLDSAITREERQSFPSKEKFIPSGAPHGVLQRHYRELQELYDISTGHAQHQSAGNDESRRFADKVAGQRTTTVKLAARIFAILLRVRKTQTFDLDSSVWRTFTKKCVNPQDSDVFDDDDLPFTRPTAISHFDADYGHHFFGLQYTYCAPIVEEGASQSLDLRTLQAPLPYLDEKEIGSGHYGAVYEVTVERSHVIKREKHTPYTYSANENVTYARKDIQLDPKKAHKNTNEWDVFQLIRTNKHRYDEYITPILACFIFDDKISLFMRRADMDLAAYLENENYKPPVRGAAQEYVAKMGMVAGALEYLHTQMGFPDDPLPCYHLDVKPENILVLLGKEKDPTFQLADFSISRVKRSFKQRTNPLSSVYIPKVKDHGSTPYNSSTYCKLGLGATCIPPELLLHKAGDEKSDVWGFGCVLCIYLSWLCGGHEGVKTFAKRRVDCTNDLSDRFVDETATSLNTAVTGWLGVECERVDELVTVSMYQSIHQFLINRVMLIDTDQRCDMSELHKNLLQISSSTEKDLKARLFSAPTSAPTSVPTPTLTRPPPRVTDPPRNAASVHETRPDNATVNTTRSPRNRQSQTTTLPSHDALQRIRPFAQRLERKEHTTASADVLLQRKATVPASTAQAERGDSMVRSQGSSFIRWISPPSRKIRSVIASPDNAYVAFLHASSVTLFKVTDQLENSDSVLVTYRGRPIKDCTVGSTHISLIPVSDKFEVSNHPHWFTAIPNSLQLCVYKLSSLFPQDSVQPVQADVVKDVRDVGEQPELIAQHPKLMNIVACLYGPNADRVRTLYILDLDVRVLHRIRHQNAQHIVWQSSFVASIATSSSTECDSRLTFTSCGTRVVWTFKPEISSIYANVHSWRLSEDVGKSEHTPLTVAIEVSTESPRDTAPN
jgi:serine/threonine protein kinase